MRKIVRDGKVAVAVSHGYGAGWSTWGDVSPMDADFNQFILDEDIDSAKAWAEKNGHYGGGIEQIAIYWVEEGDSFEISEYDGSESITVNPVAGYVA